MQALETFRRADAARPRRSRRPSLFTRTSHHAESIVMNRFVAGVILALVLCTPSVNGQCLGWEEGFGYPTVDGEIYAVEFFGNQLYLGGNIRSAGGIRNAHLIRWDGTRGEIDRELGRRTASG